MLRRFRISGPKKQAYVTSTPACACNSQVPDLRVEFATCSGAGRRNEWYSYTPNYDSSALGGSLSIAVAQLGALLPPETDGTRSLPGIRPTRCAHKSLRPQVWFNSHGMRRGIRCQRCVRAGEVNRRSSVLFSTHRSHIHSWAPRRNARSSATLSLLPPTRSLTYLATM